MTPHEILKTASDVCGIKKDDIIKRSRKRKSVIARRIACFLLMESEFNDEEISNILNLSRSRIRGLKCEHNYELKGDKLFKELFDATIEYKIKISKKNK